MPGCQTLCSFVVLIACLPAVAQQPSSPPAPSPQATSVATPQARRPNIPDTFTNLMVLPPNIPKPELMGVMKQFAVTMKVRCSACHTVSDDLSEGNFASDEKPMKIEARKLLQVIQKASAPMKPQALQP